MFGFSFAELMIVILVAIIFIKPQDLPEIAHFLGKVYYKAKRLWNDIKSQLKEAEKELGFDEIKQEIDRGIAEEKAKIEGEKREITKIIDMNGDVHEVDLSHLENDDEELKKEVEKYNAMNSKKTKIGKIEP